MSCLAQAGPRSSPGLVAQALFVALILVGCSTAGVSPPIASDFPPNAEPHQSTGVPRGVETAPGEIDPPIEYTPDQFWAVMANVPDFKPSTDGLDDAMKSADLIVVGRAVDVLEVGAFSAPGEPSMFYAEAIVEISEVLKGRPSLDASGLLHIPFFIGMGLDDTYPTHVLKDFQRSMAAEPAVLLLTSWATYFEAAGAETPSWLDGLNRADLYKTIGPEGAMRITASGIAPPLAEGWPRQELAGMTLTDFKDRLDAQRP